VVSPQPCIRSLYIVSNAFARTDGDIAQKSVSKKKRGEGEGGAEKEDTGYCAFFHAHTDSRCALALCVADEKRKKKKKKRRDERAGGVSDPPWFSYEERRMALSECKGGKEKGKRKNADWSWGSFFCWAHSKRRKSHSTLTYPSPAVRKKGRGGRGKKREGRKEKRERRQSVRENPLAAPLPATCGRRRPRCAK